MALDVTGLVANAIQATKDLGETRLVTLNNPTAHVYNELTDVNVPTVPAPITNLDAVRYQRTITVDGKETDVATYLIEFAQIGQEVRADWTLEEAADTVARRILSIGRSHDTIVILNCVVT